jgi:3-hydroxybutyryl-CoA dehydrogenase
MKSIGIVGENNSELKELFINKGFNVILKDEDDNFQELIDVDIAIENAVEKLDRKQELIKKLDMVIPKEKIIASNSSFFNITALARYANHKDRCIGLHFENPLEDGGLVEIVIGEAISKSVYERIKEFIDSIGKKAVNINDSPGLILNRVLVSMINEASYLLMYGIASMEDIDNMMKLGANFPKGPFEWADEIGLDNILASLEFLYKDLGEEYRPCPLIKKKVYTGYLGKKRGHGFYEY